MSSVIALILRRMRAPLLLLITAYVISMVGFVLLPGVDDQGQPWRMSLFHALYFVTYMASTIGFGEIPYPFTDAQRLWTIFCIYLTVISWLYAIGTILALVQDSAFRLALTETRFVRRVSRLRDPFHLVCGYGGTGSLLTHSLTTRGHRVVVIDVDPDRISALQLADHQVFVPGLLADAAVPKHLVEAGLEHPLCRGVVALTDSDHTNLKIAITSKLLNPRVPVICRAETHDTIINMKSFGTEHTVNPFDAFAERLATALHSPSLHVLHEWLTGVPRDDLAPMIYPPRGTWVLCGYGRFGKAVRKYLEQEGIDSVVVEADPEKTNCDDCIVGRGTEADTLLEANIREAVGIVAGTDDDANNLSILMTAYELNRNLFFVGRQNKRFNRPVFNAAHIDLVMQRSEIIAHEILALIITPLLSRFLRHAADYDEGWAQALVEKLGRIIGSLVPDLWTVVMSPSGAPAVYAALSEGLEIRLDHLMREVNERSRHLHCIPLMLARGSEDRLLPDGGTVLQPGDQVLFCGRWGVYSRMRWTLRNENAINYIVTGEDRPTGYVWQWLSKSAKQ